MLIFAPQATRELGAAIARALGAELAPLEEREFEDGEHKVRPLSPVRGRDVYLVQSLHGGPEASPNDKLCRLLFLAGAVRDAGGEPRDRGRSLSGLCQEGSAHPSTGTRSPPVMSHS